MRENSDCLKVFRDKVTADGEVSHEELDAIDADVLALIDDAVAAAKAAPRPTAEQVVEDVYVNYGNA